ncbi:MAG: hypothetical protein ACXABY_18555 [Candidatus Thorarchaeota archaeon]|jgi:hypothetical protein
MGEVRTIKPVGAPKGSMNNLQHGAHSQTLKQRYNDKRTKEAQRLQGFLDGLIEEAGGADALTHEQTDLLNRMRVYLIEMFQYGDYIGNLTSVVDSKGDLPSAMQGYERAEKRYDHLVTKFRSLRPEDTRSAYERARDADA